MPRQRQRPQPPALPSELLPWLTNDAVRSADISEEHLSYSDLDPRFADDAAYKRWADSRGGTIAIGKDLVNLEDSASVLSLQLTMRHWAELGDRSYFGNHPDAATRSRRGYPSEGYELSDFGLDHHRDSVVPRVRVTHPTAETCRLEFLHPYPHSRPYVVAVVKRSRLSRTLATGGTYENVDFGDARTACRLALDLLMLAQDDDDAWFAAHPGRPMRERFVCPGELQLKRTPGPWEYVQVRRVSGSLQRVLLLDSEPVSSRPDSLRLDRLAPERFLPTRIYPRHGIR
jgi:hypothetical protein